MLLAMVNRAKKQERDEIIAMIEKLIDKYEYWNTPVARQILASLKNKK